MDEQARDRLRAIGRFADELASPAFVAGHWHPMAPTREDPAVSTMPWYELSEHAEAFVRVLGGIIEPFDWPAWLPTPEAQGLYRDRAVLAAATPEQLSKLATAIVRSDRFTEGALGEAFDAGVMAAIARRASTLADAAS